jgi:hypothetical protein
MTLSICAKGTAPFRRDNRYGGANAMARPWLGRLRFESLLVTIRRCVFPLLLALAFIAGLAWWTRPQLELPLATNPSDPKPAVVRHGFCGMAEDGTIFCLMTSYYSSGYGHADLEYPPNHERYKEVRERIGPLKPGKFTTISFWPD